MTITNTFRATPPLQLAGRLILVDRRRDCGPRDKRLKLQLRLPISQPLNKYVCIMERQTVVVMARAIRNERYTVIYIKICCSEQVTSSQLWLTKAVAITKQINWKLKTT